MPWLSVNQVRLIAVWAVPTPDLALEVQRGSMPGQPGASQAGAWGQGLIIPPGERRAVLTADGAQAGILANRPVLKKRRARAVPHISARKDGT
jgi:hypothetical protein